MRISVQDKFLLFEQEFTTLLMIVVLGILFHFFKNQPFFYLAVLAVGFILYFWMMHEEEVFKTGKKHIYFEHTSSYVMIAQTALALELLFLVLGLDFLVLMTMLVSVIMYSVSLSRIVLFKFVFRQ